jgi:predicted dehydrogenase
VDNQLRFDAHIEVYGESAMVRVQYDTPYVRHLPTTLHLEETVGDEYRRTAVRTHLKDPYTCELEAFAACVIDGVPVKTTPEDYVEDMELFVEIVRRLQQDQ